MRDPYEDYPDPGQFDPTDEENAEMLREEQAEEFGQGLGLRLLAEWVRDGVWPMAE